MLEDAALFKYELAIVAILKNEAPYIKEWIDYHLLAGVDHFYLYDSESEDNLKEILQPYLDNGIVDYEFCPGKCAQMLVYNKAIQRYKFFCRYIAFIDADEFIYSKSNKNILKIVDEIFSMNKDIAGLTVNWRVFGSSGQEKANFSKPVLERFLYRAFDDFSNKNGAVNTLVKSICNPRFVEIILNPHSAIYFQGKYAVNENGDLVINANNDANTANKICINHYFTKSKEEFMKKRNRGQADLPILRNLSDFEEHDKNDVYDDSILKYRAMRQELQSIQEEKIESAQQINQRRFNALLRNLSPFILPVNLLIFDDEQDIFSEKLHIFLTCLAIIRDLKANALLNEQDASFLEELLLKCIHRAILKGSVEIWQVQLLIDELPKILSYKYPVIDDIKNTVKIFIPHFMNYRRMQNYWSSYKHLNYILQMLNI